MWYCLGCPAGLARDVAEIPGGYGTQTDPRLGKAIPVAIVLVCHWQVSLCHWEVFSPFQSSTSTRPSKNPKGIPWPLSNLQILQVSSSIFQRRQLLRRDATGWQLMASASQEVRLEGVMGSTLCRRTSRLHVETSEVAGWTKIKRLQWWSSWNLHPPYGAAVPGTTSPRHARDLWCKDPLVHALGNSSKCALNMIEQGNCG